MKIHARTLLKYPQAQLWDMLTGSFTLVFDDGELQTNDKETLYSLYCWEFHRQFPTAPLLTGHHLQKVLKGGRLTAKTHLTLIGKCLWDVYDHLCEELRDEQKRLDLRFKMAATGYDIVNEMYNDLSYRLEEYTISIDITDFVDMLDAPRMQKLYDELTPDEAGIAKLYAGITDITFNDPLVRENTVSRLARSGLISINQLHQCIGVRGYVSDSDDVRIKHPVMRGYVEGMRLFRDSIAESRSAAKAMMFSKDNLQRSEYFSRRLQFISMAVENLHHEDCGSGRYLRWTVNPPIVRGERTLYEGDLPHLVGKIYLDDDGMLKTIKASDKHLIGKKIQMRSVLYCQHPDPAGICRVCFGAFADIVPPKTNLGHMCSAYIAQQSSQMILSIKHLDGSSEIETVVVGDGDRFYIKSYKDGNSYQFADTLKTSKVWLVIFKDDAVNLTDVREVEDVRQLSVTRITELESIGIRVNDGKNEFEEEVNVYAKPRKSSLSHDMLAHIKKVEWTVDALGNAVIDMTGWDFSRPILDLPQKYFNVADHSKEMADMLEASVDDVAHRDRFVQPASLLGDLFKLVNEKLNVNIAPLEVVLYSATIVSAADNDYSLPKPHTKQGLGVMRMTMDYRSLAPRMAYERHYDIITKPASYALKNRPDHVLDMILMPREVSAARRRRQQQAA